MSRSVDLDKERFWRGVFLKHAKCGLSIARFCQANGLAPASFHAWKRVLRRRDELRKSTYVAPDSPAPSTPPALLPVRLLADEPEPAVAVRWPDGTSFQFFGPCETATLERIIAAVDAAVRRGAAAC